MDRLGNIAFKFGDRNKRVSNRNQVKLKIGTMNMKMYNKFDDKI